MHIFAFIINHSESCGRLAMRRVPPSGLTQVTVMNKTSLMLVPAGGLANRMRAVVSAYNLCRAVDGRMQVVWFRDWALNAPFRDIFKPVDSSLFALREARGLDFLVNDRPRRRNFWIPKAFQSVVFDDRIYEQFVTPLKQKNFDFEAWLRGKRCYMSCYQEFGTWETTLYKKIFRPVDEVMERVETFREGFSDYTIGMHIRRTDNAESIEKSPTALFIEAGQRDLKEHPDLRIFLATDSEEVKQQMRGVFGDRIITPSDAAERGNTAGIRGGLVDMWTLSLTRRIYGSAGSSFSTMASTIGGNELVILSVQA